MYVGFKNKTWVFNRFFSQKCQKLAIFEGFLGFIFSMKDNGIYKYYIAEFYDVGVLMAKQ